MQSIIDLSRCTFLMIGCYIRCKDILSLSRVSTLLFQFIISFTLRPAVFEEKQNKIDVLSEEPYSLRRGRATGRANRLMMYDDDKDDDAHDGPALRSSDTCGWLLRCPG